MYTKTVSALALIASLGLAQTALAQSDQPQPAGAEQTQQNAPEQPDSTTRAPAGAVQPAPAAENRAEAPDAKADTSQTTAKAGGQIVMQENDTFLASDFIGTTVYSPQDEKLGDVNDLIFARDGTIEGVVIGVGGFLGLGEKDVAFTMDRLQMTETDGGIKLSIDTTSEELADAEAFKTVKAQKVEADADRARMEQESRAPGSAVPNPANPPASAPTQAQ